MFLSSRCRRDDTGITSQVPLTKAGEDWVGGDRGGSVWLDEDEELPPVMFKFISGSEMLVNSGCCIAQRHGGVHQQKGTERGVGNRECTG